MDDFGASGHSCHGLARDALGRQLSEANQAGIRLGKLSSAKTVCHEVLYITKHVGLNEENLLFFLYLRYEMLRDWDNALQNYDSILDEDDSNSAARKRKIAIYKQKGDNVKAISELNKYLKE